MQARKRRPYAVAHESCSEKGVLKRVVKFLAVILVICLVLPGCSWMTKSGRQQMAYRNYVRKHIRERQRELARAGAESNRNLKPGTPSAPKVSMNVEPAAEPVIEPLTKPAAEPVTISASTASENDNTQTQP